MSEIEVYRPERGKVRIMAAGGVLLLAGVAVGFFLGYSTAPKLPEKVAIANPVQEGADPTGAVQPGLGSEAEPKPEALKTNEESETKGNPIGASGPASTSPPTGTLPSGPIPDRLPGEINSGVAPVNPVDSETGPPRTSSAEYREYTIVVSESDVESTHRRVSGLIQEAKGQISLSFVHDPDRPELGQDLVAGVDPDKASKLYEALDRLSGSQETDRWSGFVDDRALRAQRFLRDAINGLEKRIRELKVRYLDDAPEVVRNSEMQSHYQRGLNSMKAIPAGKPVIRVFVGKSLPPWG